MMFELLLGHLAGDYLLQNEWMAQNKAKNTWIGWMAATLHCMVYTWTVCLFMWNFQLIWFVAVFFSHFFIDKFAFGKWYLKHLKGLDMMNYDTPIRAGFNAVIYTVTDNTMHLILMWGAYKLIYA
jgi:hypothetical protein